MKLITKKILICTLVVAIALSTVSVAFASTPGGVNRVDINWSLTNGYVAFYFSHSNTLRLLDRATPTGLNLSTFRDIINPGSGSAMLNAIGFFARHINSATVDEIRVASAGGNGVRISFPWHTGLPTVRAQAGVAVLPPPRVQITVTASPSYGGRTSGGGSIPRYSPHAAGRLNRSQLWAHPNSGWQFDGWYEDGVRINSNNTFSFPTDRNRNIQARFSRAEQGGATTTLTPPPISNLPVGEVTLTLQQGDTYELINISNESQRIIIGGNGFFDMLIYDNSGVPTITNIRQMPIVGFDGYGWLTLEPGEKMIFTFTDTRLGTPINLRYEGSVFSVMRLGHPAIYRQLFGAGESVEFTNSSNEYRSIVGQDRNPGGTTARMGQVSVTIYNSDGSVNWQGGSLSRGWQEPALVPPGGKIRITCIDDSWVYRGGATRPFIVGGEYSAFSRN